MAQTDLLDKTSEVMQEAMARIEEAWIENGLQIVVANDHVQSVEWLSKAAIHSLLGRPDILRRLLVTDEAGGDHA